MYTLATLPYILTLGELFLTLEADDEDAIIDDKYVINDFYVRDIDSFIHVLNIVAYWQLYKIPVEIIVYSLLNRDEVLNSLQDEASEHSQIYRKDFLYNVSLIKYKNEVIDYLKLFYNGRDKELMILSLTLSKNITLEKKEKRENRTHMVTSGSEYQIIHNQLVNITINSIDDNILIPMDMISFFKINKISDIDDIAENFDFIMISKFIYYLENYEVLDKVFTFGYYGINKMTLKFPKGRIVVTEYNRNIVLKELTSLYAKIREEMSSFLPMAYYEITGWPIRYSDYDGDDQLSNVESDLLNGLHKKIFNTFKDMENTFDTYSEYFLYFF
jgi:hypothetical protein